MLFILKGWRLLSLLIICVLVSACAKRSPVNPYVGIFQIDSGEQLYVIITEQGEQLRLRDSWTDLPLTLDEQHQETTGIYTTQFSKLTGQQFNQIDFTGGINENTYLRVTDENLISAKKLNNKRLNTFDFSSEKQCESPFIKQSLIEGSIGDKKLKKLIKQIKSERYGWDEQDSLLVLKDNKLVVEEYFNNWQRDETHLMRSVSKSITSVLFGAAMQEGKLSGAELALAEYLPGYNMPEKTANTPIKHFLNMASGLEWDEWTIDYMSAKNPFNEIEYASDAIAYSLAKSQKWAIGESFNYSGGDVAIVGEAIRKATNSKSVAQYAKHGPLSALCFQNAHWLTYADGSTNVGAGVSMRPIDMIKVGKLMLDGGVWNGLQIIDKQWVNDSFDPAINPYNVSYGYFWWRTTFFSGGESYPAVVARGYGDQNIVVVKSLNLVVVNTASNFESYSPSIDAMLNRFIIPALVE